MPVADTPGPTSTRPRLSRSTVVVADGLAAHRVKDELARAATSGVRVLTLASLAARLAGGLTRVASSSDVRRALREPPLHELTSLRGVAELAGFARAAAGTLLAAWSADIDLASRAADSGPGSRWAELAALELHVRDSLPAGTRLPRSVVAAATSRIHLARRLLGDVTLERVEDVPPLYRPLVGALAGVTPVRWRLPPSVKPAWAAPGVSLEEPASTAPTVTVESCANPDHEALEAVRWVRKLLAAGVRANEVALASVNVAVYDEAVSSLARSAGLPLHPAHGTSAVVAPAGQLAAALAELVLNGLSLSGLVRLLGAAEAAGDEPLCSFGADWSRHLSGGTPFRTPAQWRSALRPLAAESPGRAELLLRLLADVSLGPPFAEKVGETWLSGSALALWRRALADGPPAALTTSLSNLRLESPTDPSTSVLWCSARTLLGWPRSHVRLLGLSARSWPRRSSEEDPLLPSRLLGGTKLRELTVAQTDSRHLEAILHGTHTEAVLSRPRRDQEGREQAPSPLLRSLGGAPEVEVLPRAGTAHAVTEAERLAARPTELRTNAQVARATEAYWAARQPELTRHDGVVRSGHPVVARALAGRHSATSLKLVLRNPRSFVAKYALGWSEPEPRQPLLRLDPADRGSFLHAVLEGALQQLEQEGGLAAATAAALLSATRQTAVRVQAQWEATHVLPPAYAWHAEVQQAAELAARFLTLAGPPLPGQVSYAEVQFGGDRARGQGADAPWPPSATVTLPGTELELTGVIDRLDLSAANRKVRVTDYKSGKSRKHDGDLDGGNELQRTLYALVVRQLLGPDHDVEAALLYADAAAPLPLTDVDGSIERLSEAIIEAAGSLRRGLAVPGPGLADPFEEMLLAYPAPGAGYYYDRKRAAIDAERARLDTLLAGGNE